MKRSIQRWFVPGLAGCCAAAAIGLIPAVHLPRTDSGPEKEVPQAVPDPGLDSFNDLPPSMETVVSKHLFIPERKATGQNSFPDLVVKGTFLGTERGVVFSLKSKPQANLRVWAGHVDSALSQVADPRDPRQPIAAFLREWNIKEIRFDAVDVQHFITGEVETYAVNYTPVKKVKDDAGRGYGQGIMPQGGGGSQPATAKASAASNSGTPPGAAAPPPVGQMADRISAMMQRMTPDQQKQFLQRLGQNIQGANQKDGAAVKNPAESGANNKGNNTAAPTKKKK